MQRNLDVGKGMVASYMALHKKAHPLRRCRGFRAKPLEERKSYLKEQGVCYRCCSSTTHIAKDCKDPIKCSECNSEKHISALHPGPALWNQEALSKHGGEEERVQSVDIMSKCIEVFGTSPSPKSCSKICLVNVYP